MSRGRVLRDLKNYPNIDTETYIEYIRPAEDPSPKSGTQTYLKIFALLVLLSKGQEIENFVNEKVSDQCLPLCQVQGAYIGVVELSRKDSLRQYLECFSHWNDHEKEKFQSDQWDLLVPYFDLDAHSIAKHYPLEDSTILPWLKKNEHSSQNEGGFAYVDCVEIDPLSHGFHEVLKTVYWPTILK